MVSRIRAAWLLLIVLLAAGPPPGAAAEDVAVSLADGRAGKIHFESRTPAGYFALARKDMGPRTVIFGILRLPGNVAERAPAMVIAHGSAGVDTRVGEWADRLGALGMATFVVDSFTPRNIRSTSTDQS